MADVGVACLGVDFCCDGGEAGGPGKGGGVGLECLGKDGGEEGLGDGVEAGGRVEVGGCGEVGCEEEPEVVWVGSGWE